MKRSTDRILTTHSGSLVRTREIIEGMKARTVGRPYDEAVLAEDIRAGVLDVVRRQVEAGIDIPNDGEYARRGFMGYINERLGGLQPRQPEPEEMVLVPGRERDRFAEFSELYDKHFRFIYMYPGHLDGRGQRHAVDRRAVPSDWTRSPTPGNGRFRPTSRT